VSGRAKLFGGRLGAEIGWLYPLALLALAYGLVRRRRAPRTDPVRGGLVMWGSWLFTFLAIFSAMGVIPHTAYTAALAPPLAALGGAGIVALWRAYRAGGRAAWLLPATVLAELAWAGWLWSGYAGFLPWVRWTAAAAGLAATAVLVAGLMARVRRPGGAASAPSGAPSSAADIARAGRDRPPRLPARLVTAALATAVAAALAAPAIWSLSVLDVRYAGAAYDAGAGPAAVTSGGQDAACAPGTAGSDSTVCP
jgi:4-amino-4-deoxy-L-arabinose transferase-like glycosyltransferase